MNWWHRLLRRKKMEEHLEKELRFHLEQHANELIAQGYSPDEARRQSRLALGGSEQVKENCRDARGTRWIEDLLQDFRYAIRMLRKQPGFAAVALLTLALGSGATTVMFTVVNGVLLKPLPYPEPDRLVVVHGHTDTWNAAIYGEQNLTYPDFLDCRRSSRSLEMAGFVYSGGILGEPGVPEYVERREITPPGFQLDGEEGDVFTLLGQDTAAYLRNRRAHPVGVVARLRPGAKLSQASAELELIGQQLTAQYPDSNKGRSFVAMPLRPDVGDVRSTLWLLLGAVGLVLLIACVNVASLLLARAVSRDRELAMRVALGASRGRLVRQCLTESAVLGLSGGVLGVLVAAVGFRPFVQFWPGTLPRADEIQLDWRVLLFALTASLVSGLLFGLAPALRAPVGEVEQALRAGGRTLAGSSRRLHSGFVISEIALAVVLLVTAGMLGRTLLRLSSRSEE